MLKSTVATLVFALFTSCICAAQNYVGIWQGYITASAGGVEIPKSGYTLNIKQHKGDFISGTAYIYGKKTLLFEGILDFIGTVNIDSRKAKITELKILKYSKPTDSHELCIKLADLEFSRKDNYEYLTGKWEGELTNGKYCIPGKVFLRRYNPNDPQGIEPIPNEVLQLISKDSSTKMTLFNTYLAPPVTINVYNNVIHFEVKDYLREDNDTISVYHNRQLLLEKIRIAKKPKKFVLRLNRRSELHEIVLYAENLGSVPPNTSILTIIDGDRKHKVMIESTKETSAVIYLRYIRSPDNRLAGAP